MARLLSVASRDLGTSETSIWDHDSCIEANAVGRSDPAIDSVGLAERVLGPFLRQG